MIRNKKAVQVEIQTLLIFIAVAIIIIIFTGRMITYFQASREREVCRTSLLAADKVHQENLINCKVHYLDVSDKGISKDGTQIQPFSNDVDKNTDALKKAVADEMYDCWYKSAQGSINPFSTLEGKILSNTTKCVLCTRISFDQNLKSVPSRTDGFYSWLSSTKILGQDITYADYLNISGKNFDAGFDNSGTYYIFYDVSYYSRLRKILGTAIAGLGTGVALYGGGAVILAAGGSSLVISSVEAATGITATTLGGAATGAVSETINTLFGKSNYTGMWSFSRPEAVQQTCDDLYT